MILTVALYVLWQHRFERCPAFSTFNLADLRAITPQPACGEWGGPDSSPTFTLKVDPAHPGGVATRLALPIPEAVEFLELRFQLAANNLTPGKQLWEDGRAMIEWHFPAGGTTWENDAFGSARFDHVGRATESVTRPDHPPAIPILRIENLGTGGEFKVMKFEGTVLRERLIWKIGRWVLMAGWMFWVIAWLGFRRKNSLIRASLAAFIVLLTTVYFIVPGPWKTITPFGASFQIGEVSKNANHTAGTASPLEIRLESMAAHRSKILKPVGKIPDKGDYTLQFKHYAEKARPILHAFLLFGPTLLLACLVGRKPALFLSIMLALGIEAAQVSFGYGFDRTDVIDLVCDGVGIVIALIAHRYLRCRFPRLIAT